jgi:hypothetical protein
MYVMGMRVYACYDYGIYVVSEDLEVYANNNDYDIFDLMCDIGNYYDGGNGECYIIDGNEFHTAGSEFYPDNSFCILSLKRFPSLFRQAYLDENEALKELKETYGEYLPLDFDYKKNFVHYVGTVYG